MMQRPFSGCNAVARNGFSLIEAAIVLGLVGVVIGGIWTAAAVVNQNKSINQSIDGIMYTVNNIRYLFNGNVAGYCQSIGCTANINVTQQMMRAGVIPSNYTLTTFDLADFPLASNTDALNTPMGVKMLYESGDWSSYGHIFGLKIVPVFLNIEQPLCMKLIAAISSRFKDNTDLQWVETSASGGLSSFPIPQDTALTLCPTGGNNYLMFYFNAY